MRWRLYTVLLPTDIQADPFLDIQIEGPVGPDPQAVGADGFYLEWRNRPLRVPQKALLVGGGANPAFVPRFRLGYQLSVVAHDLNAPTLPALFLSASLVGPVVFNQAGAVTAGGDPWGGAAGLPDLVDAAGHHVPIIRVQNVAGSAAGLFRIYLGINEAKDEDRNDTGSV